VSKTSKHIAQTPFQFFMNALKDHPFRAFSIFLADMAQAAFILMIPFAVRDIVNVIEKFEAGEEIGSLATALEAPFAFFIGVVIAGALASRVSGMVLLFYAPLIRVKPRLRLVDHLKGQSINYFQNALSGSLGNKISYSCDGMAMSVWTFFFEIWPMLTKLFFSIFLLYMASASLAWSFMIWAIVYFVAMIIIANGMGWAMEKLAHQRSRITGQIVDMATNIQTVKSYAREEHEEERLLKTMKDEKKAHFRFQYIREFGGIFHTVMSVGIMLLLMRDMLELYEGGAFTLGDLTYVFSIMLIVTEQARGLSWGMMSFLESLGQMRDGVKTVMQPQRLSDDENARDIDIEKPSLVFEQVNFSYTDNENAAVFENLNLAIPAYQKIGLIGPSGAGKSSLVSMIMRFYDVSEGAIKLGGHDLRGFTQNSLRQHIAVIPQDTSLFHRSLMENIRYGNLVASDEQVMEAAKKAHAHDFIDDLPEGYDTMVGERGLRLSGGQRQRIAIARAILKDAPLLILDEATAALDSESEEAIQKSLEGLMEGKTVIAIAHRLSTIQSMDRLLVMQQGQIVEDGTHEQLLQKEGGLYARLWAKQSGGFLKGN
jgi:ATP-binding cassette subfamily B protein